MNDLYSKGKEGFLGGDIAFDDDVIKMVAFTSDYVANLATDQFLSDITEAYRVAVSPALANKTIAGGVADADDVLFEQMTGSAVAGFVLFQDTGDAATSRLICHWDSGVGLPFTPNGNDVLLVFDNGANKIFKL